MTTGKKILISHYRVGMTDGVSLEIEKRIDILKELGFETILLSGPKSEGFDYVIDELDFDLPKINKLNLDFFNPNIKDQEVANILTEVDELSSLIKEKIQRIIDIEKPNYMFLHNILSHGRHIAASKSFFDIIQEYKIPTLGMHHDFYFERPVYASVTHPHLLNFLENNIPPKSPLITHATINTRTQRILKEKKDIDSLVITDTFNFEQESWIEDDYNNELSTILHNRGIKSNDITILQATRIVSRKSIELMIQLVEYINKKQLIKEFYNQKTYNDKIISEESNVHLLIVGYAEEDAKPYLEELKQRAQGLDYIHFMGDIVQAEREQKGDIKMFSLWDCYTKADMISYPSTFEGWGNQFIEAVFAKLPIVCYEYPVFKSDIKPFKYNYISLGDQTEKDSSYQCLRVLPKEQIIKSSQDLLKFLFNRNAKVLLEENFNIGVKYHSYSSLKNNLKTVLARLNNE